MNQSDNTGNDRRPRLIVVGNEKGGSGKSTTAMHLVVALLHQGARVGTIDLDARQGTLSRYIENREKSNRQGDMGLLNPRHCRLYASTKESDHDRRAEDEANLEQAVLSLWDCDDVVIDTPGSDSVLSRLGHGLADILITPMNDSLLDMDMLATVSMQEDEIHLVPGPYSEMVWDCRRKRALAQQPPIDWIVMRNRLSHIDARNKRQMERVLESLAGRFQFRVAPGFGERVIFRELFPKGLTVIDLENSKTAVPLQMSHVVARQEVRTLLKIAKLEKKE